VPNASCTRHSRPCGTRGRLLCPADDGRTVLLFIDLKDSSDMPANGEPFFQGLSARVTFTPVMSPQDFQAGMAKMGH